MISKPLVPEPDDYRKVIRVLLIEDNQGDAGLVEVALEGSGESIFDLQIEQRLSPALSRLSKERPDVILLDLNLPDSHGFDTVTAVQEVAPRTPVVILTGSDDDLFARRAIHAGVQDYLLKNEIHPNALMRSIFFAIERKGTENELHALERIASAAISSLDLRSLLALILDTLRTEMSADRTAVVIEEHGQLEVEAATGSMEGIDTATYQEIENRLNQEVMREGTVLFYELKDDDGNVLRTMLKVPLQIDNRSRGVVEVEWLGSHADDSKELSLLSVATERVALAVANAQAYEAVKASERLAEEEKVRLRTILDTLPVGIIITDAEGRQLESNAIRNKVWGGVPEPSKSIEDLCRIKAWWVDTGEAVGECPVVKALRYGQTTLGVIFDIERLDGTRGTILNSAAPIKDDMGHTIGAVGVQQDITEQIRLERDLADAKERSEFYVDLLTHDINNSLAAASGFIQLVQAAPGSDEALHNRLGRAEAALEESIKLIDTVRKIQRSRSGTPEVTSMDLDSILKEVVDQTRTKEDDRVDLSYVHQGEIKVMGTDLLRDLFSNLIGNAIKHSHRNVGVEVISRPETLQGKEYARVEVSDDGPGIPDEVKSRLFRRGERGVSKAPGRGLGLFLALSIVTGVGGCIWVEDRVPGDPTKGARFVVLLPQG